MVYNLKGSLSNLTALILTTDLTVVTGGKICRQADTIY